MTASEARPPNGRWIESLVATSHSPLPQTGQWNSCGFDQRLDDLEREGPVGRARYSYAFSGDGEFTFRIERALDGGGWRAFLDARYVRAPRAPLPS